jgi:hypothetical protein
MDSWLRNPGCELLAEDSCLWTPDSAAVCRSFLFFFIIRRILEVPHTKYYELREKMLPGNTTGLRNDPGPL